MTLNEAIKHAEEVMTENLEKTKGRNASDPIAINCFECAEEHRQLAEWLNELKQLREQARWIPVSERSPEEYGECLITWTTSMNTYPHNAFIAICEYEVTSEYDYEHCRFKGEWLLDDCIKNYPDVKVIAWMPKPKPYEPQERSDKE